MLQEPPGRDQMNQQERQDTLDRAFPKTARSHPSGAAQNLLSQAKDVPMGTPQSGAGCQRQGRGAGGAGVIAWQGGRAGDRLSLQRAPSPLIKAVFPSRPRNDISFPSSSATADPETKSPVGRGEQLPSACTNTGLAVQTQIVRA